MQGHPSVGRWNFTKLAHSQGDLRLAFILFLIARGISVRGYQHLHTNSKHFQFQTNNLYTCCAPPPIQESREVFGHIAEMTTVPSHNVVQEEVKETVVTSRKPRMAYLEALYEANPGIPTWQACDVTTTMRPWRRFFMSLETAWTTLTIPKKFSSICLHSIAIGGGWEGVCQVKSKTSNRGSPTVVAEINTTKDRGNGTTENTVTGKGMGWQKMVPESKGCQHSLTFDKWTNPVHRKTQAMTCQHY